MAYDDGIATFTVFDRKDSERIQISFDYVVFCKVTKDGIVLAEPNPEITEARETGMFREDESGLLRWLRENSVGNSVNDHMRHFSINLELESVDILSPSDPIIRRIGD